MFWFQERGFERLSDAILFSEHVVIDEGGKFKIYSKYQQLTITHDMTESHVR